jgi:hypothetical protein
MADLIAILAPGLQYSLIVLAIKLWLGTTLPFDDVTIAFLILGSIGIVLWHRKELSQIGEAMGTPGLPLGGVGNRVLWSGCPARTVAWSG